MNGVYGFFYLVRMKENATRLPEVFYCRHMETGTARYHNETILINGESIKKMAPSFVGKPVYVNHQDVDVENLQQEADGYVTDSFYNTLDGWLWAKFIVVSDKGHDAVRKGWSVSNAYSPSTTSTGGTHHNVLYDREITNGIFNHLAIVNNPRYESAKIFTAAEFKAYQATKEAELKELQNSKGVKKMKFFKNKREEVQELDADTSIELENGKVISLQEMINAVTEKEKKASQADKMSKIVKVGDKEMTVQELVNSFAALSEKRNEDMAEEDEPFENEEEKAKKAKECEAEKAKVAAEAEKTNALKEAEKAKGKENFDKLKNAKEEFCNEKIVIETQADRLARGKKLY